MWQYRSLELSWWPTCSRPQSVLGGQALSVVATEHSVDVLCGVPVVEFAGHVVEGVLDEREVDGVQLRLVPLGSQRRRSPLVCSLLGRCHGERGSHRYTLMLQLCSMSGQRAISRPWSQVRVLTSSTG